MNEKWRKTDQPAEIVAALKAGQPVRSREPSDHTWWPVAPGDEVEDIKRALAIGFRYKVPYAWRFDPDDHGEGPAPFPGATSSGWVDVVSGYSTWFGEAGNVPDHWLARRNRCIAWGDPRRHDVTDIVEARPPIVEAHAEDLELLGRLRALGVDLAKVESAAQAGTLRTGGLFIPKEFMDLLPDAQGEPLQYTDVVVDVAPARGGAVVIQHLYGGATRSLAAEWEQIDQTWRLRIPELDPDAVPVGRDLLRRLVADSGMVAMQAAGLANVSAKERQMLRVWLDEPSPELTTDDGET